MFGKTTRRTPPEVIAEIDEDIFAAELAKALCAAGLNEGSHHFRAVFKMVTDDLDWYVASTRDPAVVS